MLFVTNRAFVQGPKTVVDRKVDFAIHDNSALQSVFYCRRNDVGDYTEIGSQRMLNELRDSDDCKQVLVFIHGFGNLPEDRIFQRAERLQKLLDEDSDVKTEVVPFIWPCDSDQGIVQDYFDDQKAADASGYAFSRVMERLRAWQLVTHDAPCLKRINVLAHSMGNRVYRETMRIWSRDYLNGTPPIVFRNSFLVAADVVNETLEADRNGAYIPMASRNTIVYFASDDRALQASKVANVRNQIASRRLGHTGPENMAKVARNVYALDCDAVNSKYDKPTGHTYFIREDSAKGGKVFDHILHCVKHGRVPRLSDDAETRVDFL